MSAKQNKQAGITVKSITPLNNIVLSQNGLLQPAHAPVWEDKGSSKQKNAVAFDIGSRIPAALQVQLSGIAGDGYLEGVTRGKVLFTGKTGNSATVDVTCATHPGSVTHWQNETIQWQLRFAGKKIVAAGNTDLDLYWINLLHIPNSIYRKGTPLELIRNMFPAKNKSTLFSKTIVSLAGSVHAIVANVFGNVPPRYDIWYGANYFTTITSWNNITLHYNAYLNAHNNLPNSILNCYDAAAILQYCLGYYSFASYYCFMSPFGYLLQTNLIGRGPCNNPFYGNGGPAIIGRQNPSRTAFGNHAFLALVSNAAIVDACAGPHTGTEYAAAYVNNATDSIYPVPPQVQRGTTANIGYYTGVTHVNLITSIRSPFANANLEVLKKTVGYSSKAVKNNAGKLIAGAWPNPLKYKALGNKWRIVHEEIVPGEEEVLKMYMLKNGNKVVMLKIYVSSGGNQLAANRFLTIASLSQKEEFDFEKGGDNSGHYSVIKRNKGGSRFVGHLYNVALEIFSSDSNVDAGELAQWYFDWAAKQLAATAKQKTAVASLRLTGNVTEKITVTHNQQGNTMIEYLAADGNARLVSEKDKELVLDSIKPGTTKMRFAIIDKDTLLVNSQDVLLKNVK